MLDLRLVLLITDAHQKERFAQPAFDGYTRGISCCDRDGRVTWFDMQAAIV